MTTLTTHYRDIFSAMPNRKPSPQAADRLITTSRYLHRCLTQAAVLVIETWEKPTGERSIVRRWERWLGLSGCRSWSVSALTDRQWPRGKVMTKRKKKEVLLCIAGGIVIGLSVVAAWNVYGRMAGQLYLSMLVAMARCHGCWARS